MQLESFKAVMSALNTHGVRCLLVGGMAVVAHGHGRMTHGLDLVIKLERENIIRTFQALADLDYRPRVPVTAEAFADPNTRQGWIDEKNMTVLNLYSEPSTRLRSICSSRSRSISRIRTPGPTLPMSRASRSGLSTWRP